MNFLFFLFFSVALVNSSYSQQISNELYDNSVINEIPRNWLIRDSARGDLNKDGNEDLVLVIQNDSKENYKTNNSFGYDSINANKRLLLIFFKTGNSYKLVNKSDNILPEHVSPTMDDPYWGVQIIQGVLQTGYNFWANAGSWLMYSTTYKFRFQDNDFYLIGLEYESTHRASMEQEIISVNFSTRKANIKTIVHDSDGKKTTSEWETFELENLNKISDVIPTQVEVLGRYL